MIGETKLICFDAQKLVYLNSQMTKGLFHVLL